MSVSGTCPDSDSCLKEVAMSIPDYQVVMLPLLKLTADGKEHHIRDAVNILAEQFGLTEQERKELLPSGIDRIFDNRIGWARTYLKKAGLIAYPKRGYFKATERGQNVLAQNLPKINVAFLKQYPEFVEFSAAKKTPIIDIVNTDGPEVSNGTPEETLGAGYVKLRKQIESELLVRVKACAPEFFERLVVTLLTTMGYGGSLADAGRAIGLASSRCRSGSAAPEESSLDSTCAKAAHTLPRRALA